VFDPTVQLKRFFGEGNKGEYLFLVDEAHNLVERGRQMYSQRIVKEQVLLVKRLLAPVSKRVERALNRVNRILLEYKRECESYTICDSVNDLLFALMRAAAEMERLLQRPLAIPERDAVMEFYFDLRNFLNIYELVDENYVIYSSLEADGSFGVKLYCADPSANIQRCLDKARSTIFFSATLLPIGYYKGLLSTKEDNYAVYAHSVFRSEQRLLLVANDVSSKYTRRGPAEYGKIADWIRRIAGAKKGNYIAFFPSYQMLEQVQQQFLYLAGEELAVLTQTQNMNEAKRQEFLEEFDRERDRSMVAFCVLGGIFGEGVDLKEERLIGAIIVGTGIPQIGGESEILKNYFDSRDGRGFDYVYRFPGMNKVQQAAGRVIRTLSDVGVIALLDERFLERENLALFPREWEDYRVCSLDGAEKALEAFWKK
jgi:Rad3-related DNA helicase